MSPACLAFEEALCQADLEAYEDLIGVECRMAFEDAYACVGTLDCRELEAGQCSEFVAVIERACS